jgi:hypothetical protein
MSYPKILIMSALLSTLIFTVQAPIFADGYIVTQIANNTFYDTDPQLVFHSSTCR